MIEESKYCSDAIKQCHLNKELLMTKKSRGGFRVSQVSGDD